MRLVNSARRLGSRHRIPARRAGSGPSSPPSGPTRPARPLRSGPRPTGL